MDESRLDAYDYDLPDDLIAQSPAHRREASRLLVVHRDLRTFEHRGFSDFESYFTRGDVIVLNDTRVVPARAFGRRSDTGGRVEVLFADPSDGSGWNALVKARGYLRPGTRIIMEGDRLELEVIERGHRGATVVMPVPPMSHHEVMEWLERHGSVPLPHYIKREASDGRSDMDRDRYQTVYARTPGAVAAPTAGLHFTDEILARLAMNGVEVVRVTLHVGIGTFAPVLVDDLEEHRMHAERFEVSRDTAECVNRARAAGRRVLAVGTTATRALESAWDEPTGEVRAASGSTTIFIRPPRRIRAIDALLTNFHLPKSTLLMLVSSLMTRDFLLEAYRAAIAERYRFFSYGDAMLVL